MNDHGMSCCDQQLFETMVLYFSYLIGFAGFHTAGDKKQHVCAFFSANGEKSLSSTNNLSNDDSDDYGVKDVEV